MNDIKTSIVAAVATNNIIGADNQMPWQLSTDLQRFKKITLGKPVIMGRKTHESIGMVLPGRVNIIVSRTEGLMIDGATVLPSLKLALSIAKVEAAKAMVDEIIIIGGGGIYEQTIALCDRLYITHVEAMPNGDTRFPIIEAANWRVIHQEAVPAGPKDNSATLFRIYERVLERKTA